MSIVKCVLVSLLIVSPFAAHAADAPAKSDTSASTSTNANGNADTVMCMDGATSKGGRGACSGHGGIMKKDSPPPGATARCKDGSYYSLKEHKGACGKHGGVDQWLDK